MALVYIHKRLDTNEVFYVGIGKDSKRAYTKSSRNKHWHSIVKKAGYEVIILFDALSYEEASTKEKELIKQYGRADLKEGSLVNMIDGGDGTLGFVQSKEQLEKLSKIRKGRKLSEDHKKKLINYLTGREVSKDTKKKIGDAQRGEKNHMFGKSGSLNGHSKKVVQTDKKSGETVNIFGSTMEAERVTGILCTAIQNCCNGLSKTSGGYIWKYIY
jgi:hypothetical protein